MFRLQHRFGVLVAALLTTIVAVLWAQILVVVLLPADIVRQIHVLPAIIVILTAFPLAHFVWLKVRANFTLSRELQRLVDRDRLTSLASRDFFFGHMSRFPRSSGTALMIDIDHFKDVNDTFGHFAGDEVIKRVAQLLLASVSEEDIVCRFGGEEFMVFLNGCSPAEAYQTAERMRTSIQQNRVLFEDVSIDVTVSIGGARKAPEAPISQAIRDADIALYSAKSKGRNQTIVPEVSPVIVQNLH